MNEKLWDDCSQVLDRVGNPSMGLRFSRPTELGSRGQVERFRNASNKMGKASGDYPTEWFRPHGTSSSGVVLQLADPILNILVS